MGTKLKFFQRKRIIGTSLTTANAGDIQWYLTARCRIQILLHKTYGRMVLSGSLPSSW